MRIEADFYGEDLVAAELLGIAKGAADLRPAFREALDVLRMSATRQFDSEGMWGSDGWTPLAASTVRQKQAAGLDNGILQRTFELRDSLTEAGATGAIGRVRQDSMEFGTAVDYARFHQSGTRTMPRRRPMETTKSDRLAIVRAVHDRVMREVAVA